MLTKLLPIAMARLHKTLNLGHVVLLFLNGNEQNPLTILGSVRFCRTVR